MDWISILAELALNPQFTGEILSGLGVLIAMYLAFNRRFTTLNQNIANQTQEIYKNRDATLDLHDDFNSMKLQMTEIKKSNDGQQQQIHDIQVEIHDIKNNQTDLSAAFEMIESTNRERVAKLEMDLLELKEKIYKQFRITQGGSRNGNTDSSV